MIPCANCPFRLNVKPYLRRARAKEISECLIRGGFFECHKTIEWEEDSQGSPIYVDRRHGKFCGGALATYTNNRDDGNVYTNQAVRILHRIGRLTIQDLENLYLGLVYDSFEDFINVHEL